MILVERFVLDATSLVADVKESPSLSRSLGHGCETVQRQTLRSSSTKSIRRERPREVKLVNHVLRRERLREVKLVNHVRVAVGHSRQLASSCLEMTLPPLGRRGTPFFGKLLVIWFPLARDASAAHEPEMHQRFVRKR